MTTIILGAQWGNEGKATLAGLLADTHQICARATGNHLDQHVVISQGIAHGFSILPSGILTPQRMGLVGSGVRVHIPTFFEELETLKHRGHDVQDRVYLSDRCQVILDLHIAVDKVQGTQSAAIVRIHDIFDQESFEKKLQGIYDECKAKHGDIPGYSLQEELSRFSEYRPLLAQSCADAVQLMKQAQDAGSPILVEASSGLMMDPSSGTYPFIGREGSDLGSIISSLAINPAKIKDVVGVVKAYCTVSSEGVLPTEVDGETAEHLATRGRETDEKTSQRRKCGWLDLVALRYSAAVNHYTVVNLTKLDVLDGLPQIKVAVGYRTPDGSEIDYFPADLSLLTSCEVVYKELEGWTKPAAGAKSWYDLPKQARAYIEFIQEFVGVKIRWIGTGPSRNDFVTRAV